MTDSLGKVYFIGGGQGDPDLFTLRAVKCLEAADVVFYDDLIDKRIFEYAPKETKFVSVSRSDKQADLNQMILDEVRAGKIVVRLKEGDLHLFGKLCEETQPLDEKGISFDVVPGVTAASAAAQVAGISLTDRHNAKAVAFISGRACGQNEGLTDFDFECLASFPGTLVFYMGIAAADHWSHALLKGGMSDCTPVLIVCKATFAEQRWIRTTLAEIAGTIKRENLDDSCIIIIGKITDCSAAEPVVDKSEESQWLNRR